MPIYSVPPGNYNSIRDKRLAPLTMMQLRLPDSPHAMLARLPDSPQAMLASWLNNFYIYDNILYISSKVY